MVYTILYKCCVGTFRQSVKGSIYRRRFSALLNGCQDWNFCEAHLPDFASTKLPKKPLCCLVIASSVGGIFLEVASKFY